MTPLSVGATTLLSLGGGAFWGNLQGTLRGLVNRVQVTAFSGGDTAPNGIVVPDPTLTTPNNAITTLVVQDADLSSLPVGAHKLNVKGVDVGTYADYSRFSIGSTGTTTKTW